MIGCDSVSAFGGQGKIKALNLINKSREYRQLFTSFGQEWHVTENVFKEFKHSPVTCIIQIQTQNLWTNLGTKCFVLKWWHIFWTAPTMQWCTKAACTSCKLSSSHLAKKSWEFTNSSKSNWWPWVESFRWTARNMLAHRRGCTPACKLQECTNMQDDDDDDDGSSDLDESDSDSDEE